MLIGGSCSFWWFFLHRRCIRCDKIFAVLLAQKLGVELSIGGASGGLYKGPERVPAVGNSIARTEMGDGSGQAESRELIRLEGLPGCQAT